MFSIIIVNKNICWNSDFYSRVAFQNQFRSSKKFSKLQNSKRDLKYNCSLSSDCRKTKLLPLNSPSQGASNDGGFRSIASIHSILKFSFKSFSDIIPPPSMLEPWVEPWDYRHSTRLAKANSMVVILSFYDY